MHAVVLSEALCKAAVHVQMPAVTSCGHCFHVSYAHAVIARRADVQLSRDGPLWQARPAYMNTFHLTTSIVVTEHCTRWAHAQGLWHDGCSSGRTSEFKAPADDTKGAVIQQGAVSPLGDDAWVGCRSTGRRLR